MFYLSTHQKTVPVVFFGSPCTSLNIQKEAGLSRLQIRVLPYLDELAGQLGVKPSFWKYLFSDPAFA
uniref:Uncharacterized protein n=1 Tax=Romanomermis culicivorax TaxID=13658 RepID=A0A915HRM6_ROMCU